MSKAVTRENFETQSYSMDISSDDMRSEETNSKPVSILKIIFDIFSLVIVLIIWLLLKYLVKPVRRAFLCSDLSLYQKEATHKVFPSWLLVVCCFVIPLVILILSECIQALYLRRRMISKSFYNLILCSKTFRIPRWVGNLYTVITVFLLASGINVVLTNVGKVTVGRPRPHFMETCFNVTSYNSYCTNPNQWISNYTCIGESSEISKLETDAYDVRQSFPSGHASSAFCGLIFLALYIQKYWKHRNLGLTPAIVQMGCFCVASYIAITRITDHRHHPSDVIAGGLLGTLVAVVSFLYLIRCFKRVVFVSPARMSTRY